MVNPIQQVEGVRPVVSNEAIITPDTSFVKTIQQTTGNLATLADAAATGFAQSEAKAAVQAGQSSLDAAQRQSEELANLENLGDDATVEQLKRRVQLLDQGVQSGGISRETARFHVASEVTKAIEENPFFADRIRAAAGSMLGFNPESAAVQNVFSAFQTRDQLTRGRKPTAREQRAASIARFFDNDINKALDMIAQEEATMLQNNIANAELAAGKRNVQTWWRDRAISDRVSSTQNVIGQLAELSRSGEEINANVWNSTIDDMEQASWNAVLTDMAASEQTPDITTRQNMRQEHAATYSDLREFAKNKDSDFFRADNLKRLATMQKAYATEALPVFTFLHNTFGDRTAGRIIDIIDAAGGDQTQLRNILSVSKGTAPLIDMLDRDPKEFNNLLLNTVRKAKDPTQALEDNEKRALELITNQVASVATADPETVSEFTKLAEDNGMDNLASSLILRSQESLATPKQREAMKVRWDTVRGVVPRTIVDKIENHNTNSLTGRGARVEVLPTGLSLVFNNPIRGKVQATDNPAWDDVQEINKFLQATTKGWKGTLGITNPQQEAQKIADKINAVLDGNKEARDAMKAEADAEQARARAQALEAESTTVAAPLGGDTPAPINAERAEANFLSRSPEAQERLRKLAGLE